MVEKLTQLSPIAGSFWRVSIATVLGDKVGQREREENPENARDGRMLKGAGQGIIHCSFVTYRL